MELEEITTSESALKANIDTHNIEKPKDVPDVPPKNSKISNCDIFFLLLSIFIHCCDIYTDTKLIASFFINKKLYTLSWTISFILIASFINTIVSLQMYHQDEEENLLNKKRPFLKKIIHFFTVILNIIFQFTMVQRYCNSLKYAIKSRLCKRKNNCVGQKKYFIQMLKEEEDIALLRVLECFIEAAPQLILQLSIFVQDYHGEYSSMSLDQVSNIVSSFISLAWAMVNYHRNIRLAQQHKRNINCAGTILQFLWHLFITTSRIASVLAAAIFSTICVLVMCVLHWIAMTIWLIMESRGIVNFCKTKRRTPHLPSTLGEKIKSTLFSCVFGFVYIFIYVNFEDNGTYSKHLLYYTVCFLENISAAILVVLSVPTDLKTVWYHYVISAMCIVPFIIGIIAMIFYYIQFHPSMKHQTFSLSKILRSK
ncbi:XK-related protein 6 [Phymastichus coffea]|uniref:XK-related protein 6 n=1 Tax=Phymastichus coffea TaxID=108790 RepID=UPI00273C643C|nr:XK-related protein 6 [Phymastichus coffea]